MEFLTRWVIVISPGNMTQNYRRVFTRIGIAPMLNLEKLLQAAGSLLPRLPKQLSVNQTTRPLKRPFELKITCYLKDNSAEEYQKLTKDIESLIEALEGINEIYSATSKNQIIFTVVFNSLHAIAPTENMDKTIESIIGDALIEMKMIFRWGAQTD